jgi:ubiquitin C-terminal hydrolase
MDHAEGMCPLCNTFTHLYRKVEYRYTGDRVAIFRLIRFSFAGSGSKIGRHIAFPLIHNENYHLRSIIVHQGRSLHSGHYYALVKRDDQWFKVNDEVVSRVAESYVLRQKAYLLFYVKINKAEGEAEAEDEEKIEAEAKAVAKAEEKADAEEKAGAKAEAEERADAEDEPVGIKNNNNSCFINATMQSLASLPSFVRDFKDSDDRGEYGELLQDFINW